MNYLEFRSGALQGLTLVPQKQRKIQTKDELERWIRSEYERHYPLKPKGERHNETVC